jgi:CheY-like chemotaxis protein
MNAIPPASAGAGILLVEDEMIIAFELRIRLESLGHHVVSNPRKGEDAVRIAMEKKPNLVLMDISLAGEMDGIEAARRIRDARRVPVIFVTANTDEATHQRALSLSPEGFLLKPFTDAEFKEAISAALAPASFL